MQEVIIFKNYIWLIRGRIRAFQCQALSKWSKLQCKNATIKGKRVYSLHTGKSIGPITNDGKQRYAQTKTVYGWETR